MAKEAAGGELGRVGDAKPVLQTSALPADSVRSLASPGRSVAARRSPGSDVLGQSSCQVLALEIWTAWRQLPGGPGDLCGMDRPSCRLARSSCAERSGLSGPRGCGPRPAAGHCQGSAAYWQTGKRSSSTGSAASSPTPADRSVLNRPTGTWSGGAASGSLVRCSACSAMTARLRAGLRAETRTDGTWSRS